MPPLCPGCFKRDAPASRDACPQCDYSADQDRSPLALPVHTELRDRYQVGRVLGEPGGFGVTYLAFDERLEIRVAIKEYVPRELAGRGSDGVSVVPYSTGDQEEFEYGLERFLGEAKALAQFDHANIVSVRDFFEENGTAYLAMDYYEGKTLKQYLAEQPEKRMDPDNATEIMLRVLDGLKEVHSEGYLHRDIKPSNIYLTAEGRPMLIDFGAARLALDEKSRSLSVVMTEGYAPYEQYRREGDQGPWTDVYGAGATLYRMITGEKPPPATDRVVDDTLRPPQELDPEVPKGLSRAITDALATGNKERPQSAEALQERLRGGLRGGPSEEETAEPQQREESSRSPADVSEAPGEPSVPDGDNGYGAETSTEDNGAPWPSVFIGVLVVAALGLGGVAVALYPSGQEGGTIQLVEEARRHLDAGRLTSPEGTNALSAARQAVERNPGSEEAKKLLGQIADRLAEKGAEARRKGNLQAAMGFFERSLEIESQPKVRDELEAVGSRIREQYERLLSEVRPTLNEEAPTASELEAAAGAAREARKLRPEKGEAEKHLDQIASRAVGLGESAEASFQYGKAVRYYDQGLKLRGGAAVRKKLESVRKIRAGRMPIRILHGHENTVNTAAFSLEESLLCESGVESEKQHRGSEPTERMNEQSS
ncbi:serine/threonine protein kinase, partial [Salinibacter ruber]|uniref:serine/threonine protein kinase n=1 Tax=Salinibacter ruber TaxID=146919 RepID=UPI002073FFF5